jgi:small subunit ribosomal protein S16
MAVVIRLKRTGRRNRPCYRISVADSRWKKEGRTLENLGLYDPLAPKTEMQCKVDVEGARRWIMTGAQPSWTVYSLFKKHGVYQGELELGRAGDKVRKARRITTKTRARRDAAKASRLDAKAERRKTRVAAKRAAGAAGDAGATA